MLCMEIGRNTGTALLLPGSPDGLLKTLRRQFDTLRMEKGVNVNSRIQARTGFLRNRQTSGENQRQGNLLVRQSVKIV